MGGVSRQSCLPLPPLGGPVVSAEPKLRTVPKSNDAPQTLSKTHPGAS